MKKSSIALIVLVIALAAGATLFFMKQSADAAKRQSNAILDEFKTIDESLQKSNLKIDSMSQLLKDSITKLEK